MNKQQLRILCPNSHLGFMRTNKESFQIGAETYPDYYCCNSGSSDIGSVPLGSDTSVSLYEWQKHDLELMLLASRTQGVPMIIGSAGDTGTNSRVDLYMNIVKRIAWKYNLAPFKLVSFYSEVTKEYLREKLERGIKIERLDGRTPLILEDLDKTDRIVAVAGVHPFLKALEMGADVIIGGRSSDVAVFASAALHEGFPEHLAYYLGNVLKGASLCAEPCLLNETVIGTITHEDIKVTAMHPRQRCTIASVANYVLYERANPRYDYITGERFDMSNCKYEQNDERTVRITGPVFKPVKGTTRVKLEGAGKVGERFIGILEISDQSIIHNIDKVIEIARSQVQEQFSEKNYQLMYKIYRKEVMGDQEPVKESLSYELGIVIEGIAETEQIAEELTVMASRQVFSTHLPGTTLTSCTSALRMNTVLPAQSAYHWAMNHVIPVDDPMELFEIHELTVDKSSLDEKS